MPAGADRQEVSGECQAPLGVSRIGEPHTEKAAYRPVCGIRASALASMRHPFPEEWEGGCEQVWNNPGEGKIHTSGSDRDREPDKGAVA